MQRFIYLPSLRFFKQMRGELYIRSEELAIGERWLKSSNQTRADQKYLEGGSASNALTPGPRILNPHTALGKAPNVAMPAGGKDPDKPPSVAYGSTKRTLPPLTFLLSFPSSRPWPATGRAGGRVGPVRLHKDTCPSRAAPQREGERRSRAHVVSLPREQPRRERERPGLAQVSPGPIVPDLCREHVGAAGSQTRRPRTGAAAAASERRGGGGWREGGAATGPAQQRPRAGQRKASGEGRKEEGRGEHVGQERPGGLRA